MVDQALLDDVKSLLDRDFGDDRILKQIFRACQRDEVISNYERNYVKHLAEMHLEKKPSFSPDNNDLSQSSTISTSPPPPPPTTPDVVLPLTSKALQIQPLQKSQSKSFLSSKKGKVLIGIGIFVVLIMVIAAVAFVSFVNLVTDGTGGTIDVVTPPVTPIIPLSPAFEGSFIQTDVSSYVHKDLISINGAISSDTDQTVHLTIKDPNDIVVWNEQLSLKSNGEFSTLIIAGGLGWDDSGLYTLTAATNVDIIEAVFSFTR